MFARRKRTPFKGPMLGPGVSGRRRSNASSAEGSVPPDRRSGEVIAEEDEEDVEEVETFSPVEGPDTEYLFAEATAGEDAKSVPGSPEERGGGTMVEERTLKALETGS